MLHTSPVSHGLPGEQLLSLHWREDASPRVLQEELFGGQVVLVPVPAFPAVRTARANSLDHLESPWLAGYAVSIRHLLEPGLGAGAASGHLEELLAAGRHCGSAGERLGAPALSEHLPSLPKCTQK